MIAIPSIAFDGFSGSAKDVTARNVHGRNILSCRTWPTGQATNAQLSRRDSLKIISKGFKNMTDDQRFGWDRLAGTASGKRVLGQAAEISGLNLYIRLNFNRVMAGESIITDAPEALNAVPYVYYNALWITPSAVIIKGIRHENLPNKLVVKMSGGQSAGVSSGWNKTVILSPGMQEDWGDADVTKLYFETLGVNPTVGEKVFVEMYWLDVNTGVTGLIAQDAKVCITEEEAEAQGFSIRYKYNPDDLYQGKTSTVGDFNIDFSTGSQAVQFYADCEGSSTPGYSSVYLNAEIPAEMRYAFHCLGRSNGNDGKYLVQLDQINLRQSKQYASVQISTIGGSQSDPHETFGVGIMVNA